MPRKGENIYKRKDGRWEGRYKVGHNDSGTAKYRSIYGKTYQSVKEKLIALKAIPTPCTSSGRLTVKELFEEWLSAVKLKVKSSTYANYLMKADKHILPEFGNMRYEHLTVKMLHSFIDKKLSDGLSAKYVSNIVIVFKSMAKYISRVHGFGNPLTDVILPKVTKNEMKLLSESQQNQLCRYLMKNMNNTSLCVLIASVKKPAAENTKAEEKSTFPQNHNIRKPDVSGTKNKLLKFIYNAKSDYKKLSTEKSKFVLFGKIAAVVAVVGCILFIIKMSRFFMFLSLVPAIVFSVLAYKEKYKSLAIAVIVVCSLLAVISWIIITIRWNIFWSKTLDDMNSGFDEFNDAMNEANDALDALDTLYN